MIDVSLNNKVIGSIENPDEFILSIKNARRGNKLPKELNISFDKREKIIHLYIEKGGHCC
jgi:hypothetical protein